MEIVPLAGSKLDEIEPLWTQLLVHHAAAEPEMATRPRAESWRLRRAAYETWLAGDGFGMLARDAGETIGYAMVNIEGPDETWDLGPRTAELETLVVRPHRRGDGIGSRLVDAVDSNLSKLGIENVLVGVVAGNVDALRFYERLGWRVRYLTLHRHLTREDAKR
jgi:ribosomal protein S18 acetylase RimI-like enzyme